MKLLGKSVLVLALLFSPLAWAGDEPDLQGRVQKVDIQKNFLLVKNVLENDIGPREYRVTVKQGMINDYKKNDELKVWLMKDRKEAKHIERVDR